MLDESEDDDEASFIEQALDNLAFNEGNLPFGMFEFEIPDEKDLDHIIDLKSEEEEDDFEGEDDERARLN